jgi:hypothetical protein
MTEARVGTTQQNEEWASKARLRYSSRPATDISRQTTGGSVRSRLSVPTAATVTVAPSPAVNQTEPVNGGISAVDAHMTAKATVSVILRS